MFNAFVWDLNPEIFKLGAFQLRYYGIIFASMLYIGYLVWRQQMLRGGYPERIVERFLVWGVIAVLAGSRLGHCLFYEPGRYLAFPLEILKFWKGGLSSHGATIGLVIALVWFARKYQMRITEVLDRFSMSACVGAAAVRLGNFFNSEVVGRQTDVTWAVRLPRFDCKPYQDIVCDQAIPRHPSQLYEFFMGMAVLGILVLADRLTGKEKRPRGLLASLFLICYFSGRFAVEFFKEEQADFLMEHQSFLTMGQYLSLLPLLAGILLLAWTIKHRNDLLPVTAPAPAEMPRLSKKARGGAKKRRK